jgi:hypothetical protein
MKKLLFFIILGLCFIFTWTLGATIVQAVDNVYIANQITVAWDAPTTYFNQEPIPETALIKYLLYAKPITGGTEIPAGDTEVGILEKTITLPSAGIEYLIGAKALEVDAAGLALGSSVIAWSDDTLVCLNGITFSAMYYKIPLNPGGMRIKQPGS